MKRLFLLAAAALVLTTAADEASAQRGLRFGGIGIGGFRAFGIAPAGYGIRAAGLGYGWRPGLRYPIAAAIVAAGALGYGYGYGYDYGYVSAYPAYAYYPYYSYSGRCMRWEGRWVNYCY